MSELVQLADALDAAQKAGYTVKWGEYAHGVEYVTVDKRPRFMTRVINSDTAERNAASAIMRFIQAND